MIIATSNSDFCQDKPPECSISYFICLFIQNMKETNYEEPTSLETFVEVDKKSK